MPASVDDHDAHADSGSFEESIKDVDVRGKVFLMFYIFQASRAFFSAMFFRSDVARM